MYSLSISGGYIDIDDAGICFGIPVCQHVKNSQVVHLPGYHVALDIMRLENTAGQDTKICSWRLKQGIYLEQRQCHVKWFHTPLPTQLRHLSLYSSCTCRCLRTASLHPQDRASTDHQSRCLSFAARVWSWNRFHWRLLSTCIEAGLGRRLRLAPNPGIITINQIKN